MQRLRAKKEMIPSAIFTDHTDALINRFFEIAWPTFLLLSQFHKHYSAITVSVLLILNQKHIAFALFS